MVLLACQNDNIMVGIVLKMREFDLEIVGFDERFNHGSSHAPDEF